MKMSHMDKVFVLKKLLIGIGRSLTALPLGKFGDRNWSKYYEGD